ncbi:hypothetical protein TRFO_36268 [Tritrichomonas foetus]|uniref:Uncharacterized protein n=1 Tax=Tritrichomonas foetus TaxID=1144522 RepID=A0A1J4JEH6_9EUKA|nr:hypothetical protein TRFO_36268 [Tritrichomonas foetus]|eukprot:OHS97512.1 hypothetical protein TRFO_36268 [Tritrichomonas foetus]
MEVIFIRLFKKLNISYFIILLVFLFFSMSLSTQTHNYSMNEDAIAEILINERQKYSLPHLELSPGNDSHNRQIGMCKSDYGHSCKPHVHLSINNVELNIPMKKKRRHTASNITLLRRNRKLSDIDAPTPEFMNKARRILHSRQSMGKKAFSETMLVPVCETKQSSTNVITISSHARH